MTGSNPADPPRTHPGDPRYVFIVTSGNDILGFSHDLKEAMTFFRKGKHCLKHDLKLKEESGYEDTREDADGPVFAEVTFVILDAHYTIRVTRVPKLVTP
jgi:hypothetical protein